MNQILNKIRDVDPNDSEAVKETVTTFFQNLPKHTENTDPGCRRWLQTLETIICRFPKFCGAHRITIEHYIRAFLDSSDYYNVILAAKCGHAVQQVRPSQEKLATPKNCWRDQMNILCQSAHLLLDTIFSKSVDIYKGNKKSQAKKFSSSILNTPLTETLKSIGNVKSGENGVHRNELLCRRQKNVFIFIQAMLVEIYPVAKPVRPQLILDTIVRAQSVTSASEHDKDITVVKTQALRTLDALIACLGSNLIPFSALVFKIIMQTLRWSSENPSEDSRQVRISAYNSLISWLSVLRVHRSSLDRGRCWTDELTRHIVGDITPEKKVVQLTMSNQSMKNLSKKARRKLANSMLKESNIANHMPGEKNKVTISQETSDEVAITALKCAEVFLTVCGIFLKPTTHQLFQEKSVREALTLDCHSTRAIHLLRLLEATRKTSPPNLPPPTQYCLHVYSLLANCEVTEISKFCSQALLDIRLHLHCSPPSLMFALEVQEEQKKKEENRKAVSEKNLAALESLLGTERMPAQDNENMDAASDEPASKKPRLDESVADNISLSSESIYSVDSDIEELNQKEVQEEINTSKDIAETEVDIEILEMDVNDIPEAAEVVVASAVIEEPASSPILDIIEPITIPDNKLSSSIEKFKKSVEIHEARTQMPVNTPPDDIEEEQPLSMEVAYDYPNIGSEKVTVLEKLEDDNLPSTNDTDDVQITCGQTLRYSQDEVDKGNDKEAPKVNGFNKSPVKIVENGVHSDLPDSTVTKSASTNGEVSVEDMLADFVDEVNENC